MLTPLCAGWARYGRIRPTRGPPPTAGDLHVLQFAPEDVVALALMPQFPFTTDQLAKYTVTYQGRQKVDELDTYVFSMEPRQVDRQHAYFSGVVWVDADKVGAPLASYKPKVHTVPASEQPLGIDTSTAMPAECFGPR